MENACRSAAARIEDLWLAPKSDLELVSERIAAAKKEEAVFRSMAAKGAVLAVAGIASIILFGDCAHMQPCTLGLSIIGAIVTGEGVAGMAAAKIRAFVGALELIAR